jgi:ABC-type glycerol-3-phosphate transport system permease component
MKSIPGASHVFRKGWVWRLLVYTFILVTCFVFLVPIYGVISLAFRLNKEIINEGFWSFPRPFRIDNFIFIWSQGKIQRFLFNTLVVTVFATTISILLGCLTGYVFGKMRFRFDLVLFIVIISGMFFPPQVVLIPLFRLFTGLKLLDNLLSLVLVHIAFGLPICTMIMTNFFRGIPNELRSAAMIDGCNDWRILFSIMIPLAKPALTALAILQFTWIWNDFLWPLIFIQTESRMTIQMGVMQLRGQYGIAWGTQAATCIVATIPTLLIFLFMQKHFIRGLTMGAIKE